MKYLGEYAFQQLACFLRRPPLLPTWPICKIDFYQRSKEYLHRLLQLAPAAARPAARLVGSAPARILRRKSSAFRRASASPKSGPTSKRRRTPLQSRMLSDQARAPLGSTPNAKTWYIAIDKFDRLFAGTNRRKGLRRRGNTSSAWRCGSKQVPNSTRSGDNRQEQMRRPREDLVTRPLFLKSKLLFTRSHFISE